MSELLLHSPAMRIAFGLDVREHSPALSRLFSEITQEVARRHPQWGVRLEAGYISDQWALAIAEHLVGSFEAEDLEKGANEAFVAIRAVYGEITEARRSNRQPTPDWPDWRFWARPAEG